MAEVHEVRGLTRRLGDKGTELVPLEYNSTRLMIASRVAFLSPSSSIRRPYPEEIDISHGRHGVIEPFRDAQLTI